MTLTDAKGHPIERPDPRDYASPLDWVEAFHAYKRRLESEAWRAFDDAFTNAMRIKP